MAAFCWARGGGALHCLLGAWRAGRVRPSGARLPLLLRRWRGLVAVSRISGNSAVSRLCLPFSAARPCAACASHTFLPWLPFLSSPLLPTLYASLPHLHRVRSHAAILNTATPARRGCASRLWRVIAHRCWHHWAGERCTAGFSPFCYEGRILAVHLPAAPAPPPACPTINWALPACAFLHAVWLLLPLALFRHLLPLRFTEREDSRHCLATLNAFGAACLHACGLCLRFAMPPSPARAFPAVSTRHFFYSLLQTRVVVFSSWTDIFLLFVAVTPANT